MILKPGTAPAHVSRDWVAPLRPGRVAHGTVSSMMPPREIRQIRIGKGEKGSSHHFTLVFWCLFFFGGGWNCQHFEVLAQHPQRWQAFWGNGEVVVDGQAPPSARLPSTLKSADTTGTHRRMDAVSGWLVGPSKKGRWIATEIWLTELDMIETWWSSEVKACETFFNSRLCVADCHPFCCSFEHLSKDSYVGFLSKEGFLHIYSSIPSIVWDTSVSTRYQAICCHGAGARLSTIKPW